MAACIHISPMVRPSSREAGFQPRRVGSPLPWAGACGLRSGSRGDAEPIGDLSKVQRSRSTTPSAAWMVQNKTPMPPQARCRLSDLAELARAVQASLDNVTPGRRNLEALLAEAAADVNEALPDGSLLLCVAARAGDADVCKQLLTYGAETNLKDSFGTSALHCAAFGGHCAILQELLQLHGDANLCDAAGQTPLFFASSRLTCEVLAHSGGRANIRNNAGQTPLHVAAQAGIAEVVTFLVEVLPLQLLNVVDASGWTAADYAAKSRSARASRVLRMNGAMPRKVLSAYAPTAPASSRSSRLRRNQYSPRAVNLSPAPAVKDRTQAFAVWQAWRRVIDYHVDGSTLDMMFLAGKADSWDEEKPGPESRKSFELLMQCLRSESISPAAATNLSTEAPSAASCFPLREFTVTPGEDQDQDHGCMEVARPHTSAALRPPISSTSAVPTTRGPCQPDDNASRPRSAPAKAAPGEVGALAACIIGKSVTAVAEEEMSQLEAQDSLAIMAQGSEEQAESQDAQLQKAKEAEATPEEAQQEEAQREAQAEAQEEVEPQEDEVAQEETREEEPLTALQERLRADSEEQTPEEADRALVDLLEIEEDQPLVQEELPAQTENELSLEQQNGDESFQAEQTPVAEAEPPQNASASGELGAPDSEREVPDEEACHGVQEHEEEEEASVAEEIGKNSKPPENAAEPSRAALPSDPGELISWKELVNATATRIIAAATENVAAQGALKDTAPEPIPEFDRQVSFPQKVSFCLDEDEVLELEQTAAREPRGRHHSGSGSSLGGQGSDELTIETISPASRSGRGLDAESRAPSLQAESEAAFGPESTRGSLVESESSSSSPAEAA